MARWSQGRPATIDRVTDAPSPESTKKRLDLILLIGIIDFVLLLVLLYVAFVADDDAVVSVLGPIHGIGYLALLYLCAVGAGQKRWGWWFPAIVLVTAGPPGTVIGDVILRRRLRAAA